MSAGPPGPTQPQNVGADYGVTTLAASNDPEIVFPTDTNTKSIFVIAPPGNSGVVYLGWDDDVTTSNGVPLQSGSGISFDIDTFNAQLYAVADTGGDELRRIATG